MIVMSTIKSAQKSRCSRFRPTRIVFSVIILKKRKRTSIRVQSTVKKRHTILPCAFRLIFAFGSLSEIRVLRLFVGRNDDLAFAVIADRISRYAFDILTSGMYDASLI